MPKTELFVRMVAGATLVFLATWFASSLGPRLSGLVAMFPVLGTVLAVFSHRHAGAAFTTQLLRGMAAGFYAFITFSNLSAGLTHYGTTPSPLFFAQGYTSMSMWWRIGLLSSLANLVVWSVTGFLWWKVVGFW